MLSFEKKLREEVEAAVEDIKASTRKRPMAAGSKFFDIVLRVVKQIGVEKLAELDRVTVIEVVSKVYDEYIAKIDLPGEYDQVFHALIKQASVAAIGIAFDRFVSK